MLKTLRNAFKIKEIRKKLLFTFFMLIVIRIGSNVPIPGVNTQFFKNLFAGQSNDAFGFFNTLTGGSLTNMSVFALSITPYITSSIIMQLLTIAIPKLEEMQREGEDGRKKIAEYTRYLTVALALLQSIALALGFGGKGFLIKFTPISVIVVIAAMTAGSAMLMWIGERITENGVGNGISVVLLFNILSSIPKDMMTIWERFISGKTIAVAAVALAIVLAVIIAMVVFVVILQDGERRIPVQYSKKMQGKMVGGRSASIPLKVNTAGVIPVIFAMSLMSTPVVIAGFFGVSDASIGGKIVKALNSGSWFHPESPGYSVGMLLYIALIIVFAYFYTSITFNPLEVANDMKKAGGFIPGIRPGKPTSDYLNSILNYIVFIGACGLTIVCLIPIMVSGIFTVSRLSFGGTSLIIIVGVVLDTIKSVQSQMLVRNYKGFLDG